MRNAAASSFIAVVSLIVRLGTAAPYSSPDSESLSLLAPRKQFSIDTDPEVYSAGGPFQPCGTSSFNNDRTGKLPTISDCKCVAFAIRHNKGSWLIDPEDGSFQVASCGTCAFIISTGDFLSAYVGSGDMLDLIHDSIARFGKNGKVAVNGHVGCLQPSSSGISGVDWTLGPPIN